MKLGTRRIRISWSLRTLLDFRRKLSSLADRMFVSHQGDSESAYNIELANLCEKPHNVFQQIDIYFCVLALAFISKILKSIVYFCVP